MKKIAKQQQLEASNKIYGWLITLFLPIGMIINLIFSIFGVSLPAVPLDFIFCIADRESLKKQEIWKRGKIAWGWCLLSPVYMYERTKLLKESMTKFWLLIVQYCIAILVVIMSFSSGQQSCIRKWTQYGDLTRNQAEIICNCSMHNSEEFCLRKYGLI